MDSPAVAVSIIIPVYNKLAFTRQCLHRIDRDTSSKLPFEVIIVDNGSTDATQHFFSETARYAFPHKYQRNDSNMGFSRGNNIGAQLSRAQFLLFLNNDTIVRPGWLDAMLATADADRRVGVVGIKQLFPYTSTIHHTGIIFTADRTPQHIYPHADASLPHVNKQREYQAVTGSCLLIPRELFIDCGMFDEGYVNGYEDIDLCLKVRQRGRSVVCCTTSFIYHYGQITETRTADDKGNCARLMARWRDAIQPDELVYFRQDESQIKQSRPAASPLAAPRAAGSDSIYFADDLSAGSALTWVTSDLVLALQRRGAPVTIRKSELSPSIEREKRRALETLMQPRQPVGGIQIRWSHYWPQHLGLELSGRHNLELFVINYLFAQPGSQPWDYWLQCLPQNHYVKLPLSTFSRDVLVQVGVRPDDCHIVRPGYSPEVHGVEAPARKDGAFRLLTVTNSHDLERYGTKLLLEAYWQAFSTRDDVILVVKDYGATSADTTLRDLIREAGNRRARVRYISEFTTKAALIELYKSCDAFVSSHRGEGYGMKMLDAMACGLPVITPLFGGPTDFCTASNSFSVAFNVVPVEDCLDTRSLKITNSPVWAECIVDSLRTQLRRVFDDRAEARRIGELGRDNVLDRFSWDRSADQLLELTRSLSSHDEDWTRSAVPSVKPAEGSPYWLGKRISVIVPTYNRKATLLKCLRALERQTILPQEFEVIVVDDGSTDGTGDMLESESFSIEVRYFGQANQGPGAARNFGVREAQGGLVLFIGDDIYADERLLEAHLLAHAQRQEVSSAILGHIDWPSELSRSAVMDFVCGESTLQFAYAFIPKLKTLDYRFFYTSNISLKRRFLAEAMADDVKFDPCFSYAAFEDSELAVRLEHRGLEIHYSSDALAYHDHWMDLESFARREYLAGKMAVIFYRKHPQLDEQLRVRWIGDHLNDVQTLAANPVLCEHMEALDRDTDAFLRSLAKTLEQLLALQAALCADVPGPKLTTGTMRDSLEAVLGAVFEVERTRGKVEEWYSAVTDRATVDVAKQLFSCSRKLEFLSTTPGEVQKLKGTIAWLDGDVAASLRRRVQELEKQLGSPFNGHLKVFNLHRTLIGAARKADLFLQQRLGSHHDGRWLHPYRSVRGKLKRMITGTDQAPLN